MKLATKRLGARWWIVGDDDFGPYGPYDAKAEADRDRIDLVRTARYESKPGYVTCETLKGRDLE